MIAFPDILKRVETEDERQDLLHLLAMPNNYKLSPNSPRLFRQHACNFIYDNKQSFQTEVLSKDHIYFKKYCGINGYCVIWGNSNYMNYILYDSG